MNKIHLNELTFDNVGQWPILIKTGVILGVGILIVFLGYWLVIKSNFEEINVLQAKEETLKAEFEMKQEQASNIKVYQKQLELMNERFGAMLRQLPAKNEMPGLLSEISQMGAVSGLKFQLFAPQSEISHDFYIELPIQITVVGTYFQLGKFVSRVAEMNRIVTLHEFTIQEMSVKENKNASEDELVTNFTVKIYRYRPR